MEPRRSLAFGIAFAIAAGVAASAGDGAPGELGPDARRFLGNLGHGGSPHSVYDGTYYDYARVTRVEPVPALPPPGERPAGCEEQDLRRDIFPGPPTPSRLVVLAGPLGYDAAVHVHYRMSGAEGVDDDAGRRRHCERGDGPRAAARPGSYRVTYVYGDKVHVRVVDADPGRRIRVRVSVTPAG
jgi:hypothetical protein